MATGTARYHPGTSFAPLMPSTSNYFQASPCTVKLVYHVLRVVTAACSRHGGLAAGVQLLADALAEERGVHYHQVAGDLFLAPERAKGADPQAFRIPPLPPDMVRDVLQLDTARKLRCACS